MQPLYLIGEQQHAVTPLKRNDRIWLEIDGHAVDVQLTELGPHRGEIIVNGHLKSYHVAQEGQTLFVHCAGKTWRLEAKNEFEASRSNEGGAGEIKAPMPGVVVESFVNAGDRVEAGQTVLLIESMKLQTEIKATVSGVIAVADFAAGEAFEKGAVLTVIEADSDDESAVQADADSAAMNSEDKR